MAKAIHPDQDHSYAITAEVIDQSRRTIVGTGTVLVARKPFTVYAWVDRGYYRVGDTIHAHFSARTLDGKPVEGKGELTAAEDHLREDGKPVETPVQTWQLDTNARGHGPAADHGLAGRAVSALVQATGFRGQRSGVRFQISNQQSTINNPSKAATSSPSSARALTARSSASTTWN